jgi:hypothetical protein
MAARLNSLVNGLVVGLVPPTRRDERLRTELVEDALHILNRFVQYFNGPTSPNKFKSHIGTARQIDIGHVSANIRSRRG